MSSLRPGRPRLLTRLAPLAARAPSVLTALWSPVAWRSTRHALAGLLVAAVTVVVLGLPCVVWGAALFSVTSYANNPWHIALYVAAILFIPVVLPWVVLGQTALQRSRLHATLGLEFPHALRAASRGAWPFGPWRAVATWRQLAFHVLSLVTGLIGGALVVACWLLPVVGIGLLLVADQGTGYDAGLAVLAVAVVFAAPWLARGVSRLDERAARALLGPSRSEELAERVETLARSRADIVKATDAERRRIERDLHDGAQQRLVSLAMNLGIARARLTDLPEPARKVIADAHDEAVLALSEVREFIRGLHPAVLNDRGLNAALSGLAARAPLPVRVQVDLPRPAGTSVEAIAYFIVSESLTNIAKHARATHAEIAVTRTGNKLRITIKDDGVGGAAIPPPAAGPGGEWSGTGLRGLVQRAAAVDGTLSIDSPPAGPTVITAELPCES
jgi:signal transduction histidine kinase